MANTLASSPFFYYNPEQQRDNRQQPLFTPHPGTVASNAQMHHFHQQVYPSELMGQMKERPSSAGSHMYMHAAPYAFQTPIASPRPIYQKPLVLDTACSFDSDRFMYPVTPPLSISGSPSMSSGILPTPTAPVFFENIEGVKEGCEGEVKSEILAGENWTRSGSPPMTPGKCSCLLRTCSVQIPAAAVTSHNDVVYAQVSLQFFASLRCMLLWCKGFCAAIS
jgi:hypothetical protein